jgi:hypothetical protein
MRCACCAAMASVWACASRASPTSLASVPLWIRPRMSLTMAVSAGAGAAVCAPALAAPSRHTEATAAASAHWRRIGSVRRLWVS